MSAAIEVVAVASARLFYEALRAVIHGEIAAAAWRGFGNCVLRAAASDRLAQALQRRGRTNDTGVITGRGSPAGPDRSLVQPVSGPNDETEALLKQSYPALGHSSERLCAELRQSWPAGLRLVGDLSSAIGPFTVRVLRRGGYFAPHIDRCLDFPGERGRPARRLALNLYLRSVPADGGMLCFWPAPSDPREAEAVYLSSSSQRCHYFGEPRVVFAPESRDLIVFDAEVPHGVRPLCAGFRVTLSSFLGFHSATRALEIGV